MKKIIMILMAIFALGLQNVSAQDAPLKIVTNHPDFKIKVKRCAASGKTVVLDLILNNEGTNDVKIDMVVVDAWSEAYDNEGNIYQGNDLKVKVANKPDYNGRYYDFMIPTGVPMRLSIQINNVSTSAESIARFSLCIECSAWGLNSQKLVKFSNIPITRD